MSRNSFNQWNIEKKLKNLKSFGSRPPIWSISCENCKISIFNLICGAGFTQKNPFLALEK
jgi:hypothetical protein